MRIDVIDHPDADPPALPAATVVLLRDENDEIEVLMIRRGASTSFGGTWAFPGGVVEDDDVPDDGGRDPLPAARRAAVRETREELGLTVAESSLVHWSHWLPPLGAPRRYSTWFFVAAATEAHGEHRVRIDEQEVVDHVWIAPTLALDRHLAGEALLTPPTFVTLQQLIRFGDVATAIEMAEPKAFATELRVTGDDRLCVWHGDVAYGGGDPSAPGPRHRLIMDDVNGWTYLNTVGG